MLINYIEAPTGQPKVADLVPASLNPPGTVPTIAALRLLPAPVTTGPARDASTQFVESYRTLGDQGEGPFTWSSASTADDNGGTIIKPATVDALDPGRWLRDFTGAVHSAWFGWEPGGAIDNAIAMQAAIDVASFGRLTVDRVGDGTYAFGTTLTVTNSCVIDAVSLQGTALKWIGAPNGRMIDLLASSSGVDISVSLENMTGADEGVRVGCSNSTVTVRCSDPESNFLAGVVRSDPAVAVNNVTYRKCFIASRDALTTLSFGIRHEQGNTVCVDGGTFGDITAAVSAGQAAGQSVIGLQVTGECEFKSHAGFGDCVAVDLENVDGYDIGGNDFQSEVAAALAIAIRKTNGGHIHGNHIAGGGGSANGIKLFQVGETGGMIDGNHFHNFTAVGIAPGPGATLLDIEIGNNRITTSGGPVWNNDIAGVDLLFGGAASGTTNVIHTWAQRDGKFLDLLIQITVGGKTANAGAARITSLPKPCIAAPALFGVPLTPINVNSVLNGLQYVGFIDPGTSTTAVLLFQNIDGGQTALSDVTFANGSSLLAHCRYQFIP